MMWDSVRGLLAAAVGVLLVWQSTCDYPNLERVVASGNSFKLRCTKTGGWFTKLINVYWYRNANLVFKTYRWVSSSVSTVDNTFINAVQLTGTWRSHTVTVPRVHGSMAVWRCNNDNDKSTWSNPVNLSSYTAGVTPFTLSTPKPLEGNVTLNVYPDKVFDGNNFTLSCTVETVGQGNISDMVWIQNFENIFVTFSNGSYLVLENSTRPDVMDVTHNDNQHNVTMVARHYDAVNGTAWTCGIPVLSTISNMVVIQVLEPTGNVSLGVYPEELQIGTNYTLCCTVETEDPVSASHLTWRQNHEEYMVTFSDGSYDIVGNSTSTVVDLRASDNQHSLTVLAESDNSKSTTWACGIKKWQWYSNNVSITILEQILTTLGVTAPAPTSDSNTGHQPVEDRTQLHTIIGSTVGVVALTVIASVIMIIIIRNRNTAGEITEPRGSGHESALCVEDADVLEMKDNAVYESGPNDRQADEKVVEENVLYESSPAESQDVDSDKVMRDNDLYESNPTDEVHHVDNNVTPSLWQQ
ncbi:uncharacterized protein [Haliotis asinina]|uniref:uncharacterized protein n=1 Tax=Haliotis asinina TaxID=109174 RepID=UPI0035326536